MISIIVPARPEQQEIRAVTRARELVYPRERLEILVARGKQPSIQRNVALAKARGELVYFLDDDSEVQPDNLERATKHFTDSNVGVVGGPNLCPSDAPLLEQAFAATMGSWLAFGPSAARYRAIGKVRSSSEKELILCNLIGRRALINAVGGFDESLYPNEENALMDLLQKRGIKLIYDPEFIVHRRPRSSLRAFTRMLLTYGRGRAEQFRTHPTFGSIINFAPPLFCVWLIGTMTALVLPVSAWWKLPALIGLAIYLGSLLVGSFFTARPQVWFWVMPLIFFSHLFYGLGFWRGLFTRLRAPPAETISAVKVETLL